MKKFILASLVALTAAFGAYAQTEETLSVKREARKNLTIKEWNTDAKSKTRWMDRITVYDSFGRKVEQIEYAQYGQKWRETYEYGDNDKIVKEVRYDDRDKVQVIRKYEYDSRNRKAKQYNYAPNGKLLTTKIFEYSVSE